MNTELFAVIRIVEVTHGFSFNKLFFYTFTVARHLMGTFSGRFLLKGIVIYVADRYFEACYHCSLVGSRAFWNYLGWIQSGAFVLCRSTGSNCSLEQSQNKNHLWW